MCFVVGVQKKLREIVGFLEQHQGIIDCHMVDFLWAKHWDNLIPDALRKELEVNAKVIKENIHEILSGSLKCDYKHLREFLNDARKHSLEEFSECKTIKNFLQDKETPSLRVVDFMTPKKQHEVKLASSLISWLCRDSKASVVIDAGDGKGYLSSCLAFEHNLHVIGLEANAAYQESAQKRISKLKKKWKKTEDGGNYKSLAVRVTPNLRIGTICKDVFPEIEQPDCCLSGLHTCGDLAVSCLEIFTQDPSVRYLCNIGCCYNLLTRFPVSTFLSSDVSFILSSKAKMLACQSLNKIVQERELPKNSLHFRTLFEQIVKKKFPQMEFQNLGKIRCENFLEYFKLACKKIGLEPFISNEEITAEYDKYDRTRLDLFYLLRSSLAPAIEAAILLDRILFLVEKSRNFDVYLVKLFEMEISPRCYAIIARK